MPQNSLGRLTNIELINGVPVCFHAALILRLRVLHQNFPWLRMRAVAALSQMTTSGARVDSA